jgi:hypothetical protein
MAKFVDLPFGTVSELHAQIERLADAALLAGHGSQAEKRFFRAVKELEIRSRITPDPLISALLYDVDSRVQESEVLSL